MNHRCGKIVKTATRAGRKHQSLERQRQDRYHNALGARRTPVLAISDKLGDGGTGVDEGQELLARTPTPSLCPVASARGSDCGVLIHVMILALMLGDVPDGRLNLFRFPEISCAAVMGSDFPVNREAIVFAKSSGGPRLELCQYALRRQMWKAHDDVDMIRTHVYS